LVFDPANSLAEQMLRESSGIDHPQAPVALQPLSYAEQPELSPKPGTQKFHFRGDSRALLQAIATAFGLTASFDDSFVTRQVRFDLDDVDFSSALQAAHKATHTFAVPLSPKEILFANH